jgi:hypothetical protein
MSPPVGCTNCVAEACPTHCRSLCARSADQYAPFSAPKCCVYADLDLHTPALRRAVEPVHECLAAPTGRCGRSVGLHGPHRFGSTHVDVVESNRSRLSPSSRFVIAQSGCSSRRCMQHAGINQTDTPRLKPTIFSMLPPLMSLRHADTRAPIQRGSAAIDPPSPNRSPYWSSWHG